jgi:CBS domain containing-hemolysin-like protein
VFHQAEQAMVEGVLRLDERPVTELMTPRNRVVWLNIADHDEANWRRIVASGHSHFPVYEGSRDHVLGMVTVKALWANTAIGLPKATAAAPPHRAAVRAGDRSRRCSCSRRSRNPASTSRW